MIMQTIRELNHAKMQIAFKYKVRADLLDHHVTNVFGMIFVHEFTGVKYLVNSVDVIRL